MSQCDDFLAAEMAGDLQTDQQPLNIFSAYKKRDRKASRLPPGLPIDAIFSQSYQSANDRCHTKRAEEESKIASPLFVKEDLPFITRLSYFWSRLMHLVPTLRGPKDEMRGARGPVLIPP